MIDRVDCAFGVANMPLTSGRRRDGQGEFTLDTERGPKAHVYLYFAREDGTAYSPSQHFYVPEVS